jgi:hypothetical protein
MKNLSKKAFPIAMMLMMVFATTTLFAQVPEGTEGQETYPQEQQQQTLPEDQHEQWNSQEDHSTLPQEQHQLGDVEYDEEVQESDLPEAVANSLDELYPDHDVKKAFRGSDNSYKVKIENGDDKSVVYFDSAGQFVKSEKDKDKDRKDKKHKDNTMEW